jgi:hypothetical protein
MDKDQQIKYNIMNVFVVTCFCEGCEDCSDTYHVVGVFTKRAKAEAEAKYHADHNDHLHSCNTEVEPKIIVE